MTSTPDSSNIPEYSVSEISASVKSVLEGAFTRIRVRGEITEFKRYPSGHLYFSLKDEGGKISAVIWRHQANRLSLQPENGVEVIALGKISSYGERSFYQLVVESIDYAGEGAILARIEKLRLKLLNEGLFDPEKKKKLPFLPSVIGVVTSAQGAVLHDIRTTLARRFPRKVLVWPVAVQGEGAADQIVKAIDGFNIFKSNSLLHRPDLLIVARGGGSLEDLMAFNAEAVVRAVARSTIPVISAVGHETDTTLVDYASDQRAPTPTAAAELAVPVYTEIMAGLEQSQARLTKAIEAMFQQIHLRLNCISQLLPDLPTLLQQVRMRLDDRSYRLVLALPHLIERKRADLQRISGVMPPPTYMIERKKHHMALLSSALGSALIRQHDYFRQRLNKIHLSPQWLHILVRAKENQLQAQASLLEATSPSAVMARGYALVITTKGKPITSALNLTEGKRFKLRFADGEKTVIVEKRPATKGQGDLDL